MGSSVQLKDLAILIPPQDRDFHRNTVADLLQRQSINFPGAQPVSFARHHLLELQKNDYFLCEKTDGLRCLLYLTHLGDNSTGMMEAQFLIDRKNEYYYVPRETLHVPRPNFNDPKDISQYHVGTLLDGELVRQRPRDGNPERLVYLIFDCLAMDREDITNKPFDKRLARVDREIWKPLRDFKKMYPEDVAAQPFQVEMKKLELPYGIEMMFRQVLPNLPHGNDGLIFTCKTTPYVAGTDHHILKWKPPEENTIDFRLLLGEFPILEDDEGEYEDYDAQPTMTLHVNHGGGRDGGYRYFADLQLLPAEWEAMKSMGEALDGRIIECYRDLHLSIKERKNVWRPKIERDGTPRFRDDKTDANHIATVNSVLESIEDAVTEHDLMAEAQKIRTAYKARAAEMQKRIDMEKRRVDAAAAAERERREEERNRSVAPPAVPDDAPTYED